MEKEEKISEILTRGVEDVIEKDHLKAALLGGKKLRIKFGIDPTGGKIHIGRAVVLWKLKALQELGHKIILIIGDFTAQIGDPSDKLSKRPFLTKEQIKKNLKNYLPQIGKILDLKKAEVRYNSEWLAKLNFREISELADIFTVQQMVKRRNFADRWKEENEISLREFFYPMMQGYDSVVVKADVELGGTDQLFNLMAGRKVQERCGQKPQDIMTTKMILGLDGRKMSTSWGNVINVVDSPKEQYGKAMSMADSSISDYLELATGLSNEEVDNLRRELKSGTNPKVIKSRVAFEIVKRYYGEEVAEEAAQEFEAVFSKKEAPKDIPVLKVRTGKVMAADLVILSGVVESKAQAWRLITQGGFSLDSKVAKDPKEKFSLKGGEVVKIGKKNFFRITI